MTFRLLPKDVKFFGLFIDDGEVLELAASRLRDMVDSFDRLYEEGADNGMVLCLPLHPWCSGYPYRIKYLERILDYVMSHSYVWQTTADDIADYYIGNYYDQVVNHMAELRKSQHQRSNSARR